METTSLAPHSFGWQPHSPARARHPHLWKDLLLSVHFMNRNEVLDRSLFRTRLTGVSIADWATFDKYPQFAADLDGSADYIDCGDPPYLQITGACTCSAWCLIDGPTTGKIISKQGFSSQRALDIQYAGGSGGSVTFTIASNSTTNVTAGTGTFSAASGTWHHIVCIYQPSAYMDIYVDGVRKANKTSGVPAQQFNNNGSNNNWLLGARPANGTPASFFNGKIATYDFWGRALTHNEVLQLYTDPLAIRRRRRSTSVFVSSVAYSLACDSGSFSVTGTAANLEYGRLLFASSGSFSVSGTTANLLVGYSVTAEAGSFSISGTAATFAVTYVLTADSGSVSVSGTAANLEYGRVLAADSGSFVVTGTAATLTYTPAGTGTLNDYSLTCDSGSFTISGTAASLLYGRTLSASTGSYDVSGTVASLLHDRLLSATSGSYTISGTAASTLVGRYLGCTGGSYTVTGTTSSLLWDKTLGCAGGSYSVSGTAASLLKGSALSASTGSFAITGIAASLLAARILTPSSGSFTVTGTAATLTYVPSGSVNDYVLITVVGSLVSSSMVGKLCSSSIEAQTVSHSIVKKP